MADIAQLLIDKKALLLEYQTAELAILKGAQSYTIKDRTFERARLKDLVDAKKALENEIALLERGGRKVSRVVPVGNR